MNQDITHIMCRNKEDKKVKTKLKELIERCEKNGQVQGCENCDCTPSECLECLQEVHKLIEMEGK